jgi:hypothetical protein
LSSKTGGGGESPTSFGTPPRGPAAAKNAGAHFDRTENLAFVDDDCRGSSDWFSCLADGFARGTWDGGASLLMINNAAFRRSAFKTSGGFDESFPFAAA